MKKIQLALFAGLCLTLVNCASPQSGAEKYGNFSTPELDDEVNIRAHRKHSHVHYLEDSAEQKTIVSEASLREELEQDEEGVEEASLEAEIAEVGLAKEKSVEKPLAVDESVFHGVGGVEEEAPAPAPVPVKMAETEEVVLPIAEQVIIQPASNIVEEVAEEVVLSAETAPDYEVVQLEIDRPSTTSVSSFRNGFRQFSSDCNMRSRASSRGVVLGQIPRGKRLWVDNHSRSWAKVYRKDGPAFVYKGCL